MPQAPQTQQSPITATAIAKGQRMDAVKAIVGNIHAHLVANVAIRTMVELSGKEVSPRWQAHTLSNGSFFLSPEHEGDGPSVTLCVSTNYFEGALSPQSAGIVCTLFALGKLMAIEAGSDRAEPLHKAYYGLLDYVESLSEAALIRRAID